MGPASCVLVMSVLLLECCDDPFNRLMILRRLTGCLELLVEMDEVWKR
jgi:hypothetical protein